MAALIIAIFPQNSSRGNWEEQQDRTDPNSQFELARKPAWLLAFRQFGLPKWKHDFECCTFDHSDNSPYYSSVILAPEECKKNTQERYEIVKSEPAQSLVRRTFSADETAEASKNFESCSHLAFPCLLWSVTAALETAKALVLQRILDAPTGIDQLHIRKNLSSN